ncbi:MAG: hypothetical protein ACYC9Q_11835 [Bacillota bacterium]
MNAIFGQSGTSVILEILAAALVAAVGFGVKIPVIGNGRAAFFTLAAMGWVMCQLTFRVPPETYAHGWLNPFTVAGIVVGVVILLLVGAVFFHVRVPLITTERAATLLLGALMAVQVVLGLLRRSLT